MNEICDTNVKDGLPLSFYAVEYSVGMRVLSILRHLSYIRIPVCLTEAHKCCGRKYQTVMLCQNCHIYDNAFHAI